VVIRVERLPATIDGPAIARSLIRSELAGCTEAAVTAAELMISELVTNAVLYGSSPIEVELQRRADDVRAAVTDGGSERLVIRNPQERDPHGRGLLIVRSLAKDWGLIEFEAGKSVWFTLPCCPCGHGEQLPAME
jgi:anti-sigma regulatory factor (Ser/Thr protein kinase)